MEPKPRGVNGEERDIIVAEHIVKTFPGAVVALNDFSVRIGRGEVVVILGPSGSGKSTFLRCLNGLEDIDSGFIAIDEIPLDENEKNRLEIRREVGMVFQSFNLFPHMTVLENINLAQCLVQKKSRKEAMQITRELLDKVGLSDKLNSYPDAAFRGPAATGGHCPGPGPYAEDYAL